MGFTVTRKTATKSPVLVSFPQLRQRKTVDVIQLWVSDQKGIVVDVGDGKHGWCLGETSEYINDTIPFYGMVTLKND